MENRRSQSEFECLGCGYTANADINAARNIIFCRAPSHEREILFPILSHYPSKRNPIFIISYIFLHYFNKRFVIASFRNHNFM
ncbi:zinc ribbon domain-containing protein [Xylella fastidiosa]|uniref:zinc ribbon domain-containing protein n=1 Tax=Xylella fastidiosa TaxID=2371 RepID=UPI0018C40398|nr:zinc ribbon domain-containing protein [Xylella fastidiosa]